MVVHPKKKINLSTLHSQQRLGPSTVNSYAFLLISITHIIHKYCTFDLNLISIHFSPTILHSVENMNCSRYAISRENLMHLSGWGCSGNDGRNLEFWRANVKWRYIITFLFLLFCNIYMEFFPFSNLPFPPCSFFLANYTIIAIYVRNT